MERQPHVSESGVVVSTVDIPLQHNHVEKLAAASSTEPPCTVDPQVLEKIIADERAKLGEMVVSTFIQMGARLEAFLKG